MTRRSTEDHLLHSLSKCGISDEMYQDLHRGRLLVFHIESVWSAKPFDTPGLATKQRLVIKTFLLTSSPAISATTTKVHTFVYPRLHNYTIYPDDVKTPHSEPYRNDPDQIILEMHDAIAEHDTCSHSCGARTQHNFRVYCHMEVLPGVIIYYLHHALLFCVRFALTSFMWLCSRKCETTTEIDYVLTTGNDTESYLLPCLLYCLGTHNQILLCGPLW